MNDNRVEIPILFMSRNSTSSSNKSANGKQNSHKANMYKKIKDSQATSLSLYKKTRNSAIAERPCCSLFKLWQKYKREKRASGLFF